MTHTNPADKRSGTGSKRTILFVDDEPNILSGLRRMLRSLRREMNFHFVGSGQEALEFMENNHVDVIISDMRMPIMDGARLLRKVQQHYPCTMRMVLSGHAEQEAILETVGVAHQYLAKPTSPDTLREVITRACSLQDMFTNNKLKTLIAQMGTLPSLPHVYSELERKLKDPSCQLEEVGRLIAQDMAMSARMLQLVNSAFFGLFNRVESPERAVKLLGLETIKMLVLSIEVFRTLKRNGGTATKIRKLWDHSFKVAMFTKEIGLAEGCDKETVNQLFIAGLLHDIGKLVFLTAENLDYNEVWQEGEAMIGEITCWQAEQKIMEADHAEAGGYLLGLWGLPGVVVEAVAFHHHLDKYPHPSFSAALAVHAADFIHRNISIDPPFRVPSIELGYLEEAGLLDRLSVWQERCLALTREMERRDLGLEASGEQ